MKEKMKMALSYSRISDFRQCPLKFRLKYIDKAPNFKDDPNNKSVHLVRGENVHKALEDYVVRRRAGQTCIPITTMREVEDTKPLINSLMNIYELNPEHQVAIDENFQRVDWFSPSAWFRVIYDLVGFGENLLLGDYKTGKFTDYSGTMAVPGQLHFSAVVGFHVWPQFEECNAVYLYVDHKKPISHKFTRSEHMDPLKDALIREHDQINSETDFDPKKNQFCNYCNATNNQCFYSRKSVLGGFSY